MEKAAKSITAMGIAKPTICNVPDQSAKPFHFCVPAQKKAIPKKTIKLLEKLEESENEEADQAAQMARVERVKY